MGASSRTFVVAQISQSTRHTMMRVRLACLLFVVCLSLVRAQLPAGVEPLPNTTDPSYQRCNAGRLGIDPNCGYDAPFCTNVAYSGNGPLPKGCRPGITNTPPSRRATSDDLNICNCPPNHYLQLLINKAQPAGTCVPYTKLGQFCGSDLDCVEDYGRYPSSDLFNTNNPVGQLFCTDSVCVECNPAGWLQATQNKFDSVPLGSPYTCPGIDGPASQQIGYVVLLSSRPGETRTCFANGTLAGGGQIDTGLVSVAFAPATSPATTGSSVNTSSSAGHRLTQVHLLTAAALFAV